MKTVDIFSKKLKTFTNLVKKGKITEIFQALTKHFIRVTSYRMVILNVWDYVSGRFKCRIPIECRIATSEEMQAFFANWPDSKEEFDRHHEVYYKWGFKRCFIFINKKNDEIAHFLFLLTFKDRINVNKFLPRKIFRFITSESCAYVEWTYTVEKYRMLGVALQTMDCVVKYCRENGIEKLYSHMGQSNRNSVRLMDMFGYQHHANAYQIQFLSQRKHSGLYFLEKI